MDRGVKLSSGLKLLTRPSGRPITFAVKLDASIPPGTEVQITARAYGRVHPAPNCNGFVLSFSLTTT